MYFTKHATNVLSFLPFGSLVFGQGLSYEGPTLNPREIQDVVLYSRGWEDGLTQRLRPRGGFTYLYKTIDNTHQTTINITPSDIAILSATCGAIYTVFCIKAKGLTNIIRDLAEALHVEPDAVGNGILTRIGGAPSNGPPPIVAGVLQPAHSESIVEGQPEHKKSQALQGMPSVELTTLKAQEKEKEKEKQKLKLKQQPSLKHSSSSSSLRPSSPMIGAHRGGSATPPPTSKVRRTALHPMHSLQSIQSHSSAPADMVRRDIEYFLAARAAPGWYRVPFDKRTPSEGDMDVLDGREFFYGDDEPHTLFARQRRGGTGRKQPLIDSDNSQFY